jgi:hypothetical protein
MHFFLSSLPSISIINFQGQLKVQMGPISTISTYESYNSIFIYFFLRFAPFSFIAIKLCPSLFQNELETHLSQMVAIACVPPFSHIDATCNLVFRCIYSSPEPLLKKCNSQGQLDAHFLFWGDLPSFPSSL